MSATDKSTIVVFDVDGTITRGDTYLPFSLYVLKRRPHRVVRCLPLPFSVASFLLGRVGNSRLKLRFLSAIFAGTRRELLDGYAKSHVRGLIETGLRPGALAAIERHRKAGDRLVIASASFDFYIDKLAAALGIETTICTRPLWDEDDRLLAQFDGENCYGAVKLERVRTALGSDREARRVIAYSDHHSDLALLRWADTGIAVNPTPRLAAEARSAGLQIVDWSGPVRSKHEPP